MEPSIFENVSDKVIFSLVKLIKKNIDTDYIDNSADYEFYNAVESACKIFSVNPSTQDVDFIYQIIKLNEDAFEEKSLTSKLERPTLKLYQYYWMATRSQIVNEYYRDTISLYTEPEDVRDVLYNLNSNGDINFFEGELYDEDVRDSEIIDDEISDVRKLR